MMGSGASWLQGLVRGSAGGHGCCPRAFPCPSPLAVLLCSVSTELSYSSSSKEETTDDHSQITQCKSHQTPFSHSPEDTLLSFRHSLPLAHTRAA